MFLLEEDIVSCWKFSHIKPINIYITLTTSIRKI